MTERKQTCWINNRREERHKKRDVKKGQETLTKSSERERLTTGCCNMKENPVSVKSG